MKPSSSDIQDVISRTWSIVAKLAGIAIIAICTLLITLQFLKDVVIVEAIDVPSTLETNGYKSQVVAHRLTSRINQILHESYMGDDPRSEFRSFDRNPNLDVLAPNSQISLRALVGSVRDQLGWGSHHISGEFIALSDSLCLHIRIQDLGGERRNYEGVFCGSNGSVDSIVNSCAVFVVSQIEPLKAAGYLIERNPDSCLKLLKLALGEDEEHAADIHNDWATLLMYLGDSEGAAFHLKKSIMLKPNVEDYYYNLGTAYYFLNRYDEALAQTRIAIRLDPDQPDFLADAGGVLLEQKKYEDAKMYLQRALNLDSNNASALFLLGRLHLESEDTASAVREFVQCTSRNCTFPFAAFELGLLYDDLDKLDSAIKYYQLTLDIDPVHEGACVNLSQVMIKRGQYTEALQLLEGISPTKSIYTLFRKKSILFHTYGSPSSEVRTAYPHYLKGLALDSLRRIEEARGEYIRAAELDPHGDTGKKARRAANRLPK